MASQKNSPMSLTTPRPVKVPFRLYQNERRDVILIDLDVAKRFKRGEISIKEVLTHYDKAS
ncbi:hypothetical protein H5404_18215 [Vibrio parahaemolyticus]|uniref:hypothetical protein n=1 Tax=Vibrio parahaemolyticus TaxID=670 RepID=UPI0016274450|nr:hypothetical protein [Vibrio parahaemolyticus]QNE57757.1 hypothetical protein H5404_18215 [Vibrio parahaemolyticus]